MRELYELKEKLLHELKEYGKEEMSTGSLDVVDKLAHAIKNICKIIDYSEESGYSEHYSENYLGNYDMPYRGSYRGYSRDGGSYRGYSRDGEAYDSGYYDRRGRGRNARRDSMGRYASAGEDMTAKLQELMNDAPDERTRAEIQKLMSKIEQM